MKRLFGASLRVRLLIGTLLGVSAALLVAGLVAVEACSASRWRGSSRPACAFTSTS